MLNLIPPLVIISIMGLAAYSFGKIIVSFKPLLMNSKFSIYLNGVLFIICFILIPFALIGGLIESKILGFLVSWGTIIPILLVGISTFYIITKTYGVLFRASGVERRVKRILKAKAKFADYDKAYGRPSRVSLVSVSFLIAFSVMLTLYQSNVFLIMTFVSVAFVLYMLLAYVFGDLNAQFPDVTVILVDGTKIKGKLTETETDFLRIFGKNKKMFVVPKEKIKLIRT